MKQPRYTLTLDGLTANDVAALNFVVKRNSQGWPPGLYAATGRKIAGACQAILDEHWRWEADQKKRGRFSRGA